MADPYAAQNTPNYFANPFLKAAERAGKLGTPFPNSPNWDARDKTPAYGPGWEQALGFLANTVGAAGAGTALAVNGAVAAPFDFGSQALEWLMTGNPPPAPATGQPRVQPTQAALAQQSDPYGALGFDQSYTIPGSGIPMPQFPKGNNPLEMPDYTKTDQLLQSAAPKNVNRSERDQMISGAAEGLAQGSAPQSGGWGQQLAQMISGTAQGLQHSRRQLDEQALTQEQKQEEYNLKLAGVEASRAESLAKAKTDQARVHNEMATQEWKANMAQWEAGQPTVQLLGDGSVVSIGRDTKSGQTTVQRMGQEDQFKIQQAINSAKATGVQGKALTNSRILRQYGPAGAQLAVIAELATVPGVLRSMIPPDQVENFENELAEKMAAAQGLSGTAQADMVQQIEQSLYIKYLIGDPFARKNLQDFYGR